VEDIPYVTRPVSEGGVLERKGMVEVISSLEADGRKIPYDIRMGVWVTVEAETEYIKNCFEEYNAHTDPSGRYFTLYKRWHLIGLEVGVSVASVACVASPPAWPRPGMPMWWPPPSATWRPAKCSTAKAATPSGASCCRRPLFAMGGLPLGLAHGIKVVRPVKKGQSLSWADVAIDTTTHAYRIRREMETLFS
jgi:predicted homoserine dehydrogenase-like protein